MGKEPDYKILYKVILVLLRINNIKFDNVCMSEVSDKIGCNKRTLYNHIQRIKMDIGRI